MPVPERITPKFTYQEYLRWDDGQRWELIDGAAWKMTPAPSVRHQQLVGAFYRIIANALSVGKRCLAGITPTDVVLSDHDVVQPDVFVVCDRQKVGERAIHGAPDIVIEILSPATSLKDRREKKQLYEKFRVREYLLVDPVGQTVERFLLQDNGLWDRGEVFGPEQTITFPNLPGLRVSLREAFETEATEAPASEIPPRS